MSESRRTPEFEIGMLIFDGMTNLDFAGPCDMLSRVREAKVNVLARTHDPITTDAGIRVLPDVALAEAPELDLIFVPGGPGSAALMEDEDVLGFLRARAPHAAWITSVCTGALVLGAAGLLNGYRAATHWSTMELLRIVGAIPSTERVVVDRNRATGGGVTAGIDFGLTLVATIWGPERAQLIQLAQQYDPQPPFDAGSPETAPPALVSRFRALWAPQVDRFAAAAERAAARNDA